MSRMLTCWQVRIGDEWRYAEADVAAMVAVIDGSSRVRLTEMRVPFAPRMKHFRKVVSGAGVTGNRLRGAEIALRRQREKVPLFAGHLAAQQPTPEERIADFDAVLVEASRDRRNTQAKCAREARALLAGLTQEQRELVLLRWSVWGGPKEGAMLIYHIKKAKGGV